MTRTYLKENVRKSDNINYATLEHRLSHDFLLEMPSLGLLLLPTDRTSQVCCLCAMSDPITLDCGLRQGFVVSPGIFTMYTGLMAEVIRRYNLQYQTMPNYTFNLTPESLVMPQSLFSSFRDAKKNPKSG